MSATQPSSGFHIPSLPAPPQPQPPSGTSSSKDDKKNNEDKSDKINIPVEVIKNLVNNQHLSDVNFLVGPNKQKIYGHKFILSLSSLPFEKMFYGEFESNKPIEIPDITPTGFINMLKYIYGNKIDIELKEIYETYKSADKYLVNKFEDNLLIFIKEKMNGLNCCLIFEQLIKIPKEIDCLKYVKAFIKTNCSKAFNSPLFLEIDQHAIINLLELDKLNMSEYSIIISCFKWCFNELKKQNLGQDNLKKIFNPIKSYIRFSDLNLDDLCRCSDLFKFITSNEIGNLFSNLVYETNQPLANECLTKRSISLKYNLTANLNYINIPYSTNYYTVLLSSNKKLFISSISTFIEKRMSTNIKLTIYFNDKNELLSSYKIKNEISNGEYNFYFNPYLELLENIRYKLIFTFTIKLNSICKFSSDNLFEIKLLDQNSVKINLKSLNNSHPIKQIYFYPDC